MVCVYKVNVELKEASYEILIGQGMIEPLKALIARRGFSKRALIVSDQTVGELYGNQILAAIKECGLDGDLALIEAGEHTKSLAAAELLYAKAITHGLDRNSVIIALGGGVVGDLTGFVAATYLRGVPFVQIPTSLLAQVDSSVGGKVAVNHALGKNLIGAFYQPKAVLMDLLMLDSLPKREIYTGLAEIIKYGIIDDAELFAYLDRHADEILALDRQALTRIIARSCEIKARVVSQDEKETGLRIILNFGHTIAHAIESDTGYLRYNHGEAVAIGMRGAALLSQAMGLIAEADVLRVTAMLRKFHLPICAEECVAENLFNVLFRDKKTVNGKINWVLMESVGSVRVVKDVPAHLVMQALREVTIAR